MDDKITRYNNDVGLYDYINPTINLKDLNRKQVKELAKEIADGKGLYSWQEVDNNNVEYNSKNNRQEKRFKRIFNKQLNQNLAPILEKQHKQELIDRMKSGDSAAMSQWTTEGMDKFGKQFMPVMLTAATLPFGIGAFGQSVNTLGLIPAIGAEVGSWGLGYGGYKLGEKLDDSFGTNWIAPALSVASGIGGYGAGYKGMVKLGSRGWLPKGDKFMYGNQFIGDVAADTFKKNVKTFNIDAAVDSVRKLETMQKLRNSAQTLDPYYQTGVDQNIVPDDLPEYILPLSQLKHDYPKAQLVPLGKQTNVWSLDGNPLVSGKNVGYDHPLRDTQHRVLKIGNKQYYVGTDPVKNQGSNILIHQGDLPMSGSKIVPIEGNTEITKIWWEQNAPFYGKIDHPKAKVGTYVIDDVIPTEYALDRSGIFGSKHSVLSDAVDLADPKTNFRFFTYDPISGEIVQSPFVFPKNNSIQGNASYKFFERPSKLTFAERLGIPKGQRNQPYNPTATEKVYSVLGRDPGVKTEGIDVSNLANTPQNRTLLSMRNFLKQHGVNTENLTLADLKNLYGKRLAAIRTTSGHNYNLAIPDSGDAMSRYWKISGYDPEGLVGEMFLTAPRNLKYQPGANIDFVRNATRFDGAGWYDPSTGMWRGAEPVSRSAVSGVSQRMYDAGIPVIQQTNNGYGLMSGGVYKQPQRSLSVMEHYPDKITIDNNGIWHWETLDPSKSKTYGNPVYLLWKPSGKYNHIPTKSSSFFPSAIKDGQIITNVNHGSIFLEDGGKI